jgi:hypothetical protein
MSQDLKKAVSRESDKFMLRLPDGMRDRIANFARREGRSMNAEIVHILEDYYNMREHHDSLVDFYDGDSAGQLDHIEPGFIEDSRAGNLMLVSAEANAQLRTLLQQQIILLNKIVAPQPDASVADSKLVSRGPKPLAKRTRKPKD